MKDKQKLYDVLADDINKAEHSLEEVTELITAIAPDLKVFLEPWKSDVSETTEVLEEIIVLDEMFESDTIMEPDLKSSSESEDTEVKAEAEQETVQETVQEPDIVSLIKGKYPELEEELILSVIERCGLKSFC